MLGKSWPVISSPVPTHPPTHPPILPHPSSLRLPLLPLTPPLAPPLLPWLLQGHSERLLGHLLLPSQLRPRTPPPTPQRLQGQAGRGLRESLPLHHHVTCVGKSPASLSLSFAICEMGAQGLDSIVLMFPLVPSPSPLASWDSPGTHGVPTDPAPCSWVAEPTYDWAPTASCSKLCCVCPGPPVIFSHLSHA